jgi:predicted enzyme related to lactoylglutathione lyase
MMILGPIRSVRVPVRDLARARVFYRDALGLTETFANDQIATFATGEAGLVLEPIDVAEQAEVGLGHYRGVMFAVADAHATHAALINAGVDLLGAPERMAWGAWFVHFKDLDGNVLTACQCP